MADYSLACPRCQKGMWDQKNGQFPWKPGTPIAKCKDKECAKAGGVYWEDSKALTAPLAPVPVTATRNQPQPTATYTPAPALKSVADDCGEYVFLAYTLALSLDKAITEAKQSGDKGAADLLAMLGNELQAATATIYIQRQKRG